MSNRNRMIVFGEDGTKILVSGYGLTDTEAREFHDEEWPSEKGTMTVEEVCLKYTPRIKWCSRRDGFGCDQEGEWHNHYFDVRFNPAAPDTHFTAIGHISPPRRMP